MRLIQSIGSLRKSNKICERKKGKSNYYMESNGNGVNNYGKQGMLRTYAKRYSKLANRNETKQNEEEKLR